MLIIEVCYDYSVYFSLPETLAQPGEKVPLVDCLSATHMWVSVNLPSTHAVNEGCRKICIRIYPSIQVARCDSGSETFSSLTLLNPARITQTDMDGSMVGAHADAAPFVSLP